MRSATMLQLGVWAGTLMVRDRGNSNTLVTLCKEGGQAELKFTCISATVMLIYSLASFSVSPLEMRLDNNIIIHIIKLETICGRNEF